MENKSGTNKVQKEKHLKTILYEPVAPYFANVYNTLISIVQGLALGALFLAMNEFIVKPFSAGNLIFLSSNFFILIFKLITAFLLICLIWQRYADHDQYLAWPLGPWDSIIPVGFSLLECVLILSIQCKTICFLGAFIIVVSWGVLAFKNVKERYHEADTEALYIEHFNFNAKEEKYYKSLFHLKGDKTFALEFLWKIKKFMKRESDYLKIIWAVSVLIFIGRLFVNFMNNNNLSEFWFTVLVCFFYSGCILFLLCCNIRRFLGHFK